MSHSHSGVSSDPVDLQDIFASLRSSSAKNYAPSKDGSPAPALSRQSNSSGFAGNPTSPQLQILNQGQPRAVSPNPPLVSNPSKHLGSLSQPDMSQSATSPSPAGDRSSSDQTANLLNLLKFSTPAPSPRTSSSQAPLAAPHISSSTFQTGPTTHSVHGRGISASDLVASFMGKSSTPAPRDNAVTPSSTNQQDFLLKLLNRTTSSQPTVSEQDVVPVSGPAEESTDILHTIDNVTDAASNTKPNSSAGELQSGFSIRHDSPIRVFGGIDDGEPTPFKPQDLPKVEPAPKKGPLFTYINPFEQLAASSPRNSALPSPNSDGNKRKSNESVPKDGHASSRRKLTPAGDEILESIESSLPTSVNEGRTPVETLMRVGAPTTSAETVADALNKVGGKIDKEVQSVLVKAEEAEEEMRIKREEPDYTPETKLDTLEIDDQETALDADQPTLLKQKSEEYDGDSSPEVLFGAGESANDGNDPTSIANDWEDAEVPETNTLNGAHRVIPVYQFPMKPFISIEITPKDLATTTFREESMTNIARLKKGFDQIDRTLVTATNDFIVYGSPKSGGLKVIRQDDGLARHIFPNTRDRIFNVSISSANPGSLSRGVQNIIATGVSGTVYWTTISSPGEEIFDQDLKNYSLIFPPSLSHAENPSNGQLKTRAKKSSRHPEFFAIGRGKSIHIVFPAHARSSQFLQDGAVMDTDNYFKDRNLRIYTGKAGKDFAFSEDDSVILTLDKTGKLRFWDITDLVDENNATASTLLPIELKASMMTLVTALPSEKPWPTSVLFVDKLRPYTKGTALRYVIVGMKQNHTIQLWDLCLGRSVQEVSFPHEKESDAICSITYHPSSGIVVVGHPTRNSLYLLHLSAPKYNLPPISQAKFIQRVANKDSTLPKADATAIMSGLREYSFANRGELRSVDLFPSSGEPTRSAEDDDDPMLFELYVMHSKGVTCLGLRKEDMGWSKDNKVSHPIDAEEKGLLTVKDLKESHLASFSEHSSGNDVHPPTTAPKILTKASKKPTTPSLTKRDNLLQDPADPSSTNPVVTEKAEKAEKRKKKRGGAVQETSQRDPEVAAKSASAAVGADSNFDAGRRVQTELSHSIHTTSKDMPTIDVSTGGPQDALEPANAVGFEQITHDRPKNVGLSSDLLDQELQKIEKVVSAEFNRVMSHELESLYQRIAEDKRIQEAAGTAKQDAILRLVSSTLGENVEKVLSRIITTSIQTDVIPSLGDVTALTLDKRLSDVLNQHLHRAIPPLLKLALPEAISRGVQNPEVLRVISDQITGKLTGHVEKEFTKILQSSIIPNFKNLAVSLAQGSKMESDNRIREYLKKAESQHKDDSAKIDQLTLLVRGLSETVHTMAAAQSEFQRQILKLQEQAAQERQRNLAPAASPQEANIPTSSTSRIPPKSPEQEELEMISNLMNEGRSEEGTIHVRTDHFHTAPFTDVVTSGFNRADKHIFLIISSSAAILLIFDTCHL